MLAATKTCCLDQNPTGTQETPGYSPAVDELVAIAAAVASNCERCFKYHYTQAKQLGIPDHHIARAVATAHKVKSSPASAILDVARRYLRDIPIPLQDDSAPDACRNPALEQAGRTPSGCCGGGA